MRYLQKQNNETIFYMNVLKQTLINYFKDKKEIRAVCLYGSFISGKFHANSDVDIALLTIPFNDRMKSIAERVRYQTEISKLLKRNVDLVFLQEVGEILAFQIIKNGEVILENNKDAHRSFRAFLLIKCLDFQFLENRMQKGMLATMRGINNG